MSMSPLQPADKTRWRRRIEVLGVAGGVLMLVASLLNAYLLPYSVPLELVLVLTLSFSGLALGIVALVLVFRKLP